MACLKGCRCYASCLIDDRSQASSTRLCTNFAKNDYQSFSSRSLPSQGSNPLDLCKKKQTPTDVDACSLLACLKGFEPLTLWFVAKYSIQLSYKHIYSNATTMITHVFENCKHYFFFFGKKFFFFFISIDKPISQVLYLY